MNKLKKIALYLLTACQLSAFGENNLENNNTDNNIENIQKIISSITKEDRTEFVDFTALQAESTDDRINDRIIKGNIYDIVQLTKSRRIYKNSPFYPEIRASLTTESPSNLIELEGITWERTFYQKPEAASWGNNIIMEYTIGGAYYPSLETKFQRPNGEEIVIVEREAIKNGKIYAEIDGLPEEVGKEEMYTKDRGKEGIQIYYTKETFPFMDMPESRRDSIKAEYKQLLNICGSKATASHPKKK